MNTSRKLAVDILEQVLNKGAYSNIALSNELNKSKLEDKDRGLVTEIVYGTIKYKLTIDTIISHFLKQSIDKVDSFVLNILRTAIYQLRYLDKIPEFAAVDEAVEMAKKYRSLGASKFVNGVLRNYLRNKDTNFSNARNDVERLSYEYSFDKWMVKLYKDQYGIEAAEKILKGLNSVPYVTVRVNTLKTNYEDVCSKLTDYGYKVEDGYVCPEAINIIKGKSIENNPLFTEGMITVQDESAMLVAPCLDLSENLLVMDLCSAPGGKTTHISELMNNTGRVMAFDIHSNKLPLVVQNAKRLGVSNITCDVMDAAVLNDELCSKADRILLDAPCSGLGIIRKKPEIKWTKNLGQLKDIVDIQRKILITASKYLKTDGILTYSTCTINKEENEKNMLWFLKECPDFKIEPLYFGNLDNVIYNEAGFVTVLPNEAMDGFFICKLKKIGR